METANNQLALKKFLFTFEKLLVTSIFFFSLYFNLYINWLNKGHALFLYKQDINLRHLKKTSGFRKEKMFIKFIEYLNVSSVCAVGATLQPTPHGDISTMT